MEAERVPVRTPYEVPADELDDMDEVDIANTQKAERGEFTVPDSELSPKDLAYAKKWRKEHGL